MKIYPLLLALVLPNCESNKNSGSEVEAITTDHQLRAFLGITSVSTKVKIDAPVYYFEIFVFKGGKQVARLPTGQTSDPSHVEIEATLMFDNKGTVKFIGGGSTSDLSNRLDWLKVLKPSGGKAWQTGSTDKPIGMIDGFKVLAVIQGEQHGSGTLRHELEPDAVMDQLLRQRIENAESCVLIAFRSGTGEEIMKISSESFDADNKRQNKPEMATPNQPPD